MFNLLGKSRDEKNNRWVYFVDIYLLGITRDFYHPEELKEYELNNLVNDYLKEYCLTVDYTTFVEDLNLNTINLDVFGNEIIEDEDEHIIEEEIKVLKETKR